MRTRQDQIYFTKFHRYNQTKNHYQFIIINHYHYTNHYRI